jgi:hypothetical protein
LFTSNEESGTAFSKRVSLRYKISHVKVKLPPKKAFTLLHMKVSKDSMNVGSNPDNRKRSGSSLAFHIAGSGSFWKLQIKNCLELFIFLIYFGVQE